MWMSKGRAYQGKGTTTALVKAGACLSISKEAGIEVNKEGREQEVRVVARGQSTEDLADYGKNLRFYYKWNAELGGV